MVKNEWTNVKDDTPIWREPVLILTDYSKMATAYLRPGKSGFSDTWVDWMRPQHSYGGVTHWMPLPPSTDL